MRNREAETPRKFASADLDEIIEWHARHARVRVVPDRSPAFPRSGLHLDDRQVGRVRVARSAVPADLTFVTASSEVYALTIVHAGTLHIGEPTQRWSITPGVAGLYQPARAPRRNHVLAGTRVTYLQIPRLDLERHLEDLIEQYIAGPVDFGPELTVHGEPAWLRLFRVFTDVFDDPYSPLDRPLVANPLTEAMITALLYSTDHPYQDLLSRAAAPAQPAHIRVVIDAVQAEPERAYTVALLAGIAGVGVRSLQHGFRVQVGMSPMAYLRRVRLSRVHDQLSRGNSATVAEAAHRWGFTHLGRFAASYASVYGVPPSVTLHAAR